MSHKIALFVLLAAVTVHSNPLLGEFIKDLSNMNTEIGKGVADVVVSSTKTGTDAAKDATNLGITLGKTGLLGGTNLVKNVLDNTKKVTGGVFGVANTVADNLGIIGKPIKVVSNLGNRVTDAGLDTANLVVGKVGSVGDQILDRTNNVATGTLDRVFNATSAGADYAKNTMDAVNGETSKFLS